MEVGLHHTTRMDGEGDDRRSHSLFNCCSLYLVEQKTVTSMHTVEEANGGHTGAYLIYWNIGYLLHGLFQLLNK